jgi:hypothetical protein
MNESAIFLRGSERHFPQKYFGWSALRARVHGGARLSRRSTVLLIISNTSLRVDGAACEHETRNHIAHWAGKFDVHRHSSLSGIGSRGVMSKPWNWTRIFSIGLTVSSKILALAALAVSAGACVGQYVGTATRTSTPTSAASNLIPFPRLLVLDIKRQPKGMIDQSGRDHVIATAAPPRRATGISATDSPMLTVWLYRLDQVRAKCRFKGLRFRGRSILEAFSQRDPASNLGAACARVESSFGLRRWNNPRAKASHARSGSIDIHRIAPAERRARLLNKLAWFF